MRSPAVRRESRASGHTRRALSTAIRTIRIATRASELALRQAREVESALQRLGVGAELVTYTTLGDRAVDTPLSSIGGKGIFTAELEADLRDGRVDCCVHSLKDLPTDASAGLAVVAQLRREDPRDVLVVSPSLRGKTVETLPPDSRVGTSSLRRQAQLRALRRDLDVVELRGNVPTRIRRVEDGEVDAAILAAAGIRRLDAHDRIAQYLEPPSWLPAPGQGAIAVQTRTNAPELVALLRQLDHDDTSIATCAERSLLGALGGGCQIPIGALGLLGSALPTLFGMVISLDGERVVRGEVPLDPAHPEEAGLELAAELRAKGAQEILSGIRALADVPRPQPE